MVTAAAITLITGLTGAAATAVAVVADIVLNFGPPPSPMSGRVSRTVMAPTRCAGTRPPGGIRPHDPKLAYHPDCGPAPEGCSVRAWEGWNPESKSLTGGVGAGTCLEPEFQASELLLFDRALAPRTGDVVLVEEIIDGKPYRAAKVFEADDSGDPGTIYCNDGAYRLYSRRNVKGRLVLAIRIPDGVSWPQLGAAMRETLAAG